MISIFFQTTYCMRSTLFLITHVYRMKKGVNVTLWIKLFVWNTVFQREMAIKIIFVPWKNVKITYRVFLKIFYNLAIQDICEQKRPSSAILDMLIHSQICMTLQPWWSRFYCFQLHSIIMKIPMNFNPPHFKLKYFFQFHVWTCNCDFYSVSTLTSLNQITL